MILCVGGLLVVGLLLIMFRVCDGCCDVFKGVLVRVWASEFSAKEEKSDMDQKSNKLA